MIRIMGSVFGLVIFIAPGGLTAQTPDDWRSAASEVVGTYEPEFGSNTPQAMATAAKKLIELLDVEQRKRCVLPLDDPERREWTNLPPRPNAGGITLGQMNEEQVRATCDLLATLFSRHGYEKFRDIMLADDQLVAPGRRRQGFGTEFFSIVIFGQPAADEPWAFQLDGHHLGVNVALHGEHYSVSPSFIGAQPFEFKLGEQTRRPLGAETDQAYRLIRSMDDDQIRIALTSQRRGFIRTGPGRDGFLPEALGISAAALRDDQKSLLMDLIAGWVDVIPERWADSWKKTISEELDSTRFSWQGGTADGSDMSFAVQGPSIIIEYACQDLGGRPTDHIHTMLRNPTDEYGGQIPPKASSRDN